MKNILVTGTSGQVGTYLQKSADFSHYHWVFSDRKTLDLASPFSIHNFFKNQHFDYIFHVGAYTLVEQAEIESDLAFAINAQATGILAEYAAKMQAVLFYLSTDYVFNGEFFKPIDEAQPTKPLSVYGTSKREGEILALQNNPKTLVLRTSWVHSPVGKNFLLTMKNLMQTRQELKVVVDQIGTPTSALDLAQLLIFLRDFLEQEPVFYDWGIYHYSHEGVASWYDFACIIAQKLQSSCQVLPQKTQDYPSKVSRPFYSVLDKTKIKQRFNLKIPHWTERVLFST